MGKAGGTDPNKPKLTIAELEELLNSGERYADRDHAERIDQSSLRQQMKILRPVHPNIGIRAIYKRKLLAVIDEMAASYFYWVRAAYKKHPPTMAQDESPAHELERELAKLGKRWSKKFDKMAEELAKYFATKIENRSRRALMKILRDGGFTVKPAFFKNTANVRDVMGALVAENVSLIKSIPAQFHTQVEGLVMRSVAAGRDLAPLTRDLQKQFGVTRRRAEFIARDQNNKATSQITRARYVDMGIEEAIWLHSGGGKTKRPTHVANSGKKYNIAKGWYDPDPKVRAYIQPGYLINCFPGSTEIEFAHNVEKAFCRAYRGELSEIVTASGKALTATPNHPVLTPHGWRAIGSLNEGDDLVEIAKDGILPIVKEHNKNQAKTLIRDVFDALSELGQARTEVSLRDQFHSDGRPDGYVEIVEAAGSLSFGGQACFRQSGLHFRLGMTAESGFNTRLFQQLGAGSFRSSTSDVSGDHQPLPPFDSFVLHSHPVGFTPSSNFSTGCSDHPSDSPAIEIICSREGEYTHPVLVLSTKTTRVLRTKKWIVEDHVYNLQTASNWYVVAGGIIAHNCRCVCKPIVKGFT